MKYRALAAGSILILLICAGCLNKGSPLSDFIGGKMFSGKPASGNTSTDPASTTTNIQLNATTTSFSGTTTTSLTMPRNLTCDRKWGELARDQCYLDFAVSIGEERICRNLTYKSLRENCFYSIATEQKDLAICNMVEDDLKRKQCFDTVQQTENST